MSAGATPGATRVWGNAFRLWTFYAGAVLLCWAVLIAGFGYAGRVREHWPISVVMVLGSLVAGSTPMGGGTVAFPILVLVFHQPPGDARNFALMIQALGMTSAMLFMIARGIPLPGRFLAASAAGSAAGLLAGTFVIGPHVSANLVKVLFSCIWMSFGLLTLAKNKEICGLKGRAAGMDGLLMGLAAGVVGGAIASMIGVGVEMAVYTVMVLVYRADLKIAIPTAISAAALASIEGAALHALIGDIGREAFYNWLAAAPIVIFGAPTGAWIMTIRPRMRILYFVSGLCVFQFVWTLWQTAHSRAEWLFAASALGISIAILGVLYRAGKQVHYKVAR